jgi:hypothetical protein
MPAQPYLGETLLAPGLIRLFGREFKGLALTPVALEPVLDPTSNNPVVLQEQIENLTRRIQDLEGRQAGAQQQAPQPQAQQQDLGGDPDADPNEDVDDEEPDQDKVARLARIYGFSYLGNYYKIANPPVLRVYGQGFPVRSGLAPENRMDILGCEFKDEDFVRGIRMWAVDQLDVVVRIDITIGWLREILLDTDMSADSNVTGNGGGGRADIVGRDSGLVGRDSGLVGRDSGLVGRDSGFVGRSRR